GVRQVTRVPAEVDVFHNLRVKRRPWVVTVHGYRPPAGYLDRYVDGALVPDPARTAQPPYDLPPNGICVSRTLARTFGGTRYVRNGLDPAEYLFSETKDD